MRRKIDNRKDILLLMLYAPGRSGRLNEPIAGRTRLVKMMFLFKKEALEHFRRGTAINESNFYSFFPWNFGPFSREVYDDLTFFILRGFIAEQATEEEPLPESQAEWERWLAVSASGSDPDIGGHGIDEFQEQEFYLTERGEKFAAALHDSLSSRQQTLLKEFKSKLTATPLRAILKYVYEEYEEQTTRSQIKDQVLG